MSANQEIRKRFHLCLDIGFEIMDLLETGGKTVAEDDDHELRVVEADRVLEVIKLHHPMEFSDKQTQMLGAMLAEVINRYGMSTCATWAIAHNIEHIMFDPEEVKT